MPTTHRDFDIGDSVACLRYYAGWADKIVGQVRGVSLPFSVLHSLSTPLLCLPFPFRFVV